MGEAAAAQLMLLLLLGMVGVSNYCCLLHHCRYLQDVLWSCLQICVFSNFSMFNEVHDSDSLLVVFSLILQYYPTFGIK